MKNRDKRRICEELSIDYPYSFYDYIICYDKLINLVPDDIIKSCLVNLSSLGSRKGQSIHDIVDNYIKVISQYKGVNKTWKYQIDIIDPVTWTFEAEMSQKQFDKIYKSQNKIMKKYKVKIPKGFIPVSETKTTTDGNLTISLKLEPIPAVKPIKKELPKTWEELGTITGYYVESKSCEVASLITEHPTESCNRNIWPTRKLAEASVALTELMQLRKKYNEGVELSLNEVSIYKDEADNIVAEEHCSRGPLKFMSKEIGLKFLNTFKPLLVIASPLL